MKIFISGLTSNINQPALRRLADDLLKGPWYRFAANRVNMTQCSIFRMTDLDTQRIETAALIEIASTRQAWELIGKLDGHILDGHTLRAHKWFPRTRAADRRAEYIELLGNEPMPVANDRRRRGERRRKLAIDGLNRVQYQMIRESGDTLPDAVRTTG